jgi:acetyltransferase-like isoleucine patch superfamily enzyme
MMTADMGKYKKVQDYYAEKGPITLYQEYVIGDPSLWKLLQYEFLIGLMSGLPGAPGLLCRKIFFPMIIGRCGKGVVWGKDMVIRYPRKIQIMDQCIFDDGCVLDAKGENNKGISIGTISMIGRHTILGCKNSDINIGNHVGIGAHCIIHSVDVSPVTIEDNVVIGPMVYLAGGGNYNIERMDIPIGEQGIDCRGGIHIKKNCWIGANTVILDGVTIENDAIVGAGSVVTGDLPAYSIAAGNPARIIKMRKGSD